MLGEEATMRQAVEAEAASNGGFRIALGLLLAAVAAACAVNPVSQRPEVAVISAERERQLGDEAARKVEAEMGLVTDPALLAYVQQVGARLVKLSPRQDVSYTFLVVDIPAPNAFALPNGNIYVSRGLLALAATEDELAGTLAHELAHVAARHSVRSANVAVATSPFRILTGIAGAATSIVAPRFGEGIAGVGETASAAFLAPYSREQEREADNVGLELAARAGYDPTGLPRLLERLEREAALRREGPGHHSFFDSHPPTAERVQHAWERGATLKRAPAAPVAATPREFLARLDGLRVGDNPEHGVFQDWRFFLPSLGITMQFPPDWTTRNTPHAVIGYPKDKEALMLLTVEGKGEDPVEFVRTSEGQAGGRLMEKASILEINGLRAVRTIAAADSKRGPLTLDLTWIARDGVVCRLAGVTPARRYAAYRPALDLAVQSFRGMTAADTAQIRETRLRVVTAPQGEGLADVAQRSRSVWSLQEMAIANRVAANARLQAGYPVKVTVAEPYRNRS
jgi:predicted Zn-dependent protease